MFKKKTMVIITKMMVQVGELSVKVSIEN